MSFKSIIKKMHFIYFKIEIETNDSGSCHFLSCGNFKQENKLQKFNRNYQLEKKFTEINITLIKISIF